MGFYDIDTSVRINGGLTINGDSNIPTNSLNVGGTITGNIVTGNTINAGTFNEGGVALSSKYLGINSTAVNSTNFNNLSSSQFVRSDTQTNISANIYFTSGNGVTFQTDATDSAKIYTEYDNTIASGSSQTNLVLYVSDDSNDAIVHRVKYYNSGNATDVLTLNYNKATFDSGVGLYVGSNLVWNAGNDGINSGLDADLLGGINHSKFFRNDTGGSITGNTTIVGQLVANSIASNTSSQGIYIPFPDGGSYATQTTTVSGGIKITIPQGASNTMMHFAVDVYEYSNNKSFTAYIAGYNYNTGSGNLSWYQTSAYVMTQDTTRNPTIRFGFDGTHGIIYIGELASTWSYPQVRVRDFYGGYSNYNASQWQSGWSVGFEASAFQSVTASISNTLTASSLALNSNLLGNLSSSQFLRSDTSTYLNGNLTVTGNITATLNISGNHTGTGSSLTVNGTTVNGGVNPISNGWAYTHENKIGSMGHIPTGGSATTFLRGDNTWVTPTDTYVNGLSSTAGGNGTLTVSRNTGGNLSINLAHNHDTVYLGISGTAVNANLLDNIDSTQFLRSDQNDIMGGILTISGTGATPLVLQRNGTPNVNLQFIHSSANAFLGIDGTGILKFGTVADLNASGYTVWHSNNFDPTSKTDNTAFTTHTGSTGVGYHIPTGGTVGKFLQGDGTWQTVSTIDTYVTGLSAPSGGNGILTVLQNQGQPNLTVDLTHNHDSRYLGISATASNSTLFNSLSSNQFVRNDSATTMGVGLLFSATATGGTSASTPTALSYGQLQSYGTLNILADTDGSHTEYIYLSAGYPSGGANNGLKIGYNLADLTWKGYTVWHSGNDGSGSGLDADLFDGHDSNYFVYVGQNHIFNNMSGGASYDTVDFNTLQTIGEYRFINLSTSTNKPNDSGYGYYLGMGGGDIGSRGFQLVGSSSKNLYFREMSNQVWVKLWNDQNDGSGSGLDADTVDSIQASQFVRNDSANQTVNTGFTMSGNAYVGMSNSSGALYVRTGSGSLGIQLAGDNSAKQSGVGAYINASGTATFTGTMTANAIAVTSTSKVTNLNTEMINGIKEPQLAKNQSVSELGGMGVYTGTQVQAQSVPNMTVQITAGTVYTDTGMRATFSAGGSYAFASPSATYNRIDSIYVQGSSTGANEGTITVMTGTASSSPVAPTIPSDGVLLANVTIRQNAGSILSTDIADMRTWRPLNVSGQNIHMGNTAYVDGVLDSNTHNYIQLNKPIMSPSNNSVTIPSGSTSYTWTHNLNLARYTARLSCNNPEPHIYWTSKTANAITVNLDDVCDSDVIIDISIETY